jgi:hypothetical protein
VSDSEPRERVHSPSSIALARKCQRAWALCYVDRIRPPELDWDLLQCGIHQTTTGGQRSAALGKRVHLYGEWYLTGADAADAEVYGPRRVIDWESIPGQVLQSMLDHLPSAGSLSRDDVEAAFTLEHNGVKFRGLIDVVRPDVAEIWDHKTTRDIRRYALLPDATASAIGEPSRSLKNDLQACTYVVWRATQTDPPASEVVCRWTYGETDRTRRSLPVIQAIPLTHALDVLDEAADVARTLTYETSADAPADTLRCGDYGGCFYRGTHCFERRPWGTLMAMAEKEANDMTTQKPMTFAQLREQTAKGNAAAPTPKAAPVKAAPKPAPAPEPEVEETEDRVEEQEEAPAPEPVKAASKFKRTPKPAPVKKTPEPVAEEVEESTPESGEQETANDGDSTSPTIPYGSVMQLIEALQAALPEGVTISVSGKISA